MFLKLFSKSIMRIKDVYEAGLFAIMANKDIFTIFNGSPLYFAMLPILGVLSTITGLIKGYELVRAANKNFDQWFAFIASMLSAVLTSVSLYGAVIASYYEFSFALGPWFFLASVGVGFVHQLAMLGLNSYRAYEASNNLRQRMHYVQAAISNLFALGLLSAVAGAVTFVLLTPIAPVVGSIFAITAIGMTALNILWSIIPISWRRGIKSGVYLGKAELVLEINEHENPNIITSALLNVVDMAPPHSHQRIFSKEDYSAEIRVKPYKKGLDYLEKVMQHKIHALEASPKSEKNLEKKRLLKSVLHSLKKETDFSKLALSKSYPLAFQSFWAEKGEVEQIIDAAELLIIKRNDEIHSNKAVPTIG